MRTYFRWECRCSAKGAWINEFRDKARFHGQRHVLKYGEGHAITLARKVAVDADINLSVV